MWIEKYRPQEFEQVMGLDPELPKLVNDEMPHLMFVGKAGTGKTTTARIIINKLGCDCLRLNASDERGIDVIRDKVKDFARTRSSNKRFKVVFLDEADYLTKEAQMILRGVIEAYHSNCRFILTGNYETKFDDAIKSRCKRFSFNVQDNVRISAFLEVICIAEKVKASRTALLKLAIKYNPDIRTMLNELETLGKKGICVMPDMISESDDRVEELVKIMQAGKITQAKQWILSSPFDIHYIMNMLNGYSWDSDWDKTKKLRFWEALGETEFRMGLSVDIEVQLSAGLVRMIKALA